MRFQLGNPQIDTQTNRWSVVFEAYAGAVGAEYLYATQLGRLTFTNEDAAHDSGQQALKVLEETGRLPRIF